MIQRIKLIYDDRNKTVRPKKYPIKDWVRMKVQESVDDLVYKDDFSAIYCLDRENGVFAVYAHTHRDAQKALRKHFTTL